MPAPLAIPAVLGLLGGWGGHALTAVQHLDQIAHGVYVDIQVACKASDAAVDFVADRRGARSRGVVQAADIICAAAAQPNTLPSRIDLVLTAILQLRQVWKLLAVEGTP